MGISLISTTRLNYNPELIHIWKDIVYGFRELSKNELEKYGRLRDVNPGAGTPSLRGDGAGDLLSKTPGDGGFFKKYPGGFRGILCNKNCCF